MQLTPAELVQFLHTVVGPQAIQKLVANLEILGLATLYQNPTPTKQQNVYSILKSGAFVANERLAGDSVIDQKPVDSLVNLTAREWEASFTFDAQTFAQLTPLELSVRIQDAAATVAEKINIEAMKFLALQGGISVVGTLGLPIGQTEMQGGRQLFNDNKIPQGPRVGIISTESEFALKGDAAYVDAFSFSGAITQAGLPAIEGFQLFTSAYVHAPAALQHRNLLIHLPSVQQIFPPQAPVNNVGVLKVPFSSNGIGLAMLRENMPGTNAGVRFTVSVLHGILATREEGMVHLSGT